MPPACLIFSNVSSGAQFLQAFGRERVAAVAVGQIACDATDGGYAHARLFVDLSVGLAFAQQTDLRPSILHLLLFRGGAQIAKERTAFLDAFQRENGREQRTFRQCLLAGCEGLVVFHGEMG